jgi:fructuronate reductase
MTAARLSRLSWPAAAAARPVRIVHLGTGNFSRAHQAWYTATADPEWGIAAFSGRGGSVADALSEQDGLYTLIERGPARDALQVLNAISAAHDGRDVTALSAAVAAPSTAVVTLTVTEAGYATPASNGGPNAPAGRFMANPVPKVDPSGRADRPNAPAGRFMANPVPKVDPPPILARLTRALDARRAADGAGPLALVSCDNLPSNGSVLRERVMAYACETPGLADWIQHNVSFVSTSVDRITPHTTDADRQLVVDELGLIDAVPVVTEPFTDWVLCGDFPAGRPAWEDAGARFAADVEPWEQRKLWLLNGGHSLLAYMGLMRGHATVAEAVGDRHLRMSLNDFWDLAERYLPDGETLDLPRYRAQLLDRFDNARIGYPLTQIGADGLAKLRNRVVPVVDAALTAGAPLRTLAPALDVVSAWIDWVSGIALKLNQSPSEIPDSDAVQISKALVRAGAGNPAPALVTLLAPNWRDRHPDVLTALTDRRRQTSNPTGESRP